MRPVLTSPTPAPGTYAAAVEFLAPDVVNAIERSLPCLVAADGRHIWDLFTSGCWICVYCSTHSFADPIPVDERPYPLWRSASETYGALLDGSL